jgi:predicted CopG family antitoxin
MPSQNIAVQKAVYDALTREKRAGESFTSVLRRLLEQQEGLAELQGLWSRSRGRSAQSELRRLRYRTARGR